MALGHARVSFFSLLLLAHAARQPDLFITKTRTARSSRATLKSDVQADVEDDESSLANATNDAAEAAEAEVHRVPASLAELMAWVPDRVNTHISQDVEYHNTKEEIATFPMRRPRLTNAILATLKTWGADLLAQFMECRHSGVPFQVNWRRNGVFAVFGLIYIGLVQWFLLVTVMSKLAPHAITFSNMSMEDKLRDFAGQADLVKQVFIDNMIFGTFLYFPVFYCIREVVTLGPQRDTVRNALGKYYKNMVPDNLASMAYWIPGDFLAFSAPMYMRLPVDHFLSFLWTVMLSLHRGTTSAGGEEQPDRLAVLRKSRLSKEANPQAPP